MKFPFNRSLNKLTPFISIVFGMLVGAIMMLIAGYNPLEAYKALLFQSFTEPYNFGETIRTMTPLLYTGLAVALAFRTGLFNIGVEGQLIMGQLAAYITATSLHLPPGLHALVAMLMGGLAGALWGFLPGLLKAVRGVHEVIVCIMMNFIALNISNLLIRTWLANGNDSTGKIPSSASLNIDAVSRFFDQARIHMGIVVAVGLAVFTYYFLWRTKWGFEMRAVGLSPLASEYAGIGMKRNLILSMMISGGFAGLGGASELLGTSGYLSIQSSFTGWGFDGIAVALLGANTPLGVVFSSLLFGILTYGGGIMQSSAGVPFEVVRVVFAAIILFVAIRFSDRLLRRFKKGKEGRARG